MSPLPGVPKLPHGGNIYIRLGNLEKKFEQLLVMVKEMKQEIFAHQTLATLHAEIMSIFLEKLALIKALLKLLIKDPTNPKLNDLLDEFTEEGEFEK